ncbi:MAG: anti-sigma factor [Kofleriaceae bacterium]
MTPPRQPAADPRVIELLILRATTGLTPAEAAELESLGGAGDESFDLAAAAVDVATVPRQELPDEVAQRILRAAGARPAPGGPLPVTLPGVAPPGAARSRAAGGPAPVTPLAPRRRARPVIAWSVAAFGLAAAAAALLWAPRAAPRVIVERVEVPAPLATPPSAAAARADLLAADAAAQTLPWTATADPAGQGATGDVVWSAARQEGYLRFVGLAPNDPKLHQYQLWIFDKTRDERYPVDGGVFDVGADGEVVVAIAPKLRVAEVALFAVTVEPPGGVVVSTRERIVVTAAPAS